MDTCHPCLVGNGPTGTSSTCKRLAITPCTVSAPSAGPTHTCWCVGVPAAACIRLLAVPIAFAHASCGMCADHELGPLGRPFVAVDGVLGNVAGWQACVAFCFACINSVTVILAGGRMRPLIGHAPCPYRCVDRCSISLARSTSAP